MRAAMHFGILTTEEDHAMIDPIDDLLQRGSRILDLARSGIMLLIGGIVVVVFGGSTLAAWRDGTPLTDAGSLWGIVGVAILVIAIVRVLLHLGTHRRNRAQHAALERAEAQGMPWTARTDWSAGRVVTSAGPEIRKTVGFALFWNAFMAGALYLTWTGGQATAAAWAGLLLFVGIGVALAGHAAWLIARQYRFGRSELVFDTRPGRIPGRFTGVVYTNVARSGRPASGFSVRLACIHRRMVRSIGTDSAQLEPHDTELWSLERRVEAGVEGPSGRIGVPVRIDIPADIGHETTLDNPHNRYLWQLSIDAELPGVDYHAEFEVPVYARTAVDGEDSTPGGHEDDESGAWAADLALMDATLGEPDSAATPTSSAVDIASAEPASGAALGEGVTVERTVGGGVRIVARNNQLAGGLVMLFGLSFTVLAGIAFVTGEIRAASQMLMVAIGTVLIGRYFWQYAYSVTVDAGRVAVRSGAPGYFFQRSLAFDEVADVTIVGTGTRRAMITVKSGASYLVCLVPVGVERPSWWPEPRQNALYPGIVLGVGVGTYQDAERVRAIILDAMGRPPHPSDPEPDRRT
jgi:hypothetical protein